MQRMLRGTLSDPDFAGRFAEGIFRLRYETFFKRLKWDVQVEDGREFDRFDDDDTQYVVATDREIGSAVYGTWRLRPTTVPYMLSDVFPSLLAGQAVPQHERIWEISRFAVDEKERRPGFGFNATALSLLAETTRFALTRDIHQYVMVISVAVERLFKNTGLILNRFGPAQRIGKVLSVACSIDVDTYNCSIALGSNAITKIAA